MQFARPLGVQLADLNYFSELLLALFLKRVIKNVRSHDFYSPFYSFLASRYLFRVTICKNYGSFFLGFTFFTLLIFLNYNSLTHF